MSGPDPDGPETKGHVDDDQLHRVTRGDGQVFRSVDLGRVAGCDAESRAFAAAQLNGQLRPTSLRQSASDELPTLLPMLRRLPRRFDRITNALEHGRLGVGVRLFADPRDRRFLTTLIHQILLAFLGAATGVMAVLLLGSTGGPRLRATVSLFQALGYNLLVVSAVLILRVLGMIFRPPR